MMKSSELKLKNETHDAFRRVLETYQRMTAICSVNLYYEGYQGTNHGSVSGNDEVLTACRNALVAHWRHKLELELANLRTHGVDASDEMPKELQA